MVPVKDAGTGQYRTETIEVSGPIAYAETTTKPVIHNENATRMFELYLDASVEQTEKVHEAQREAKEIESLWKRRKRAAIVRRHRNAQRLLQTVDVVIPFVRHVGFPTHKPRTRRDFPRFLEVIEAVAFLRQMQKTRKVAVDPETGESLEYVEADQEDYKIAYDCAAAAIAHGLDDLPHHSPRSFG